MPKLQDFSNGRLIPLPPGREFVVGRSRDVDLPVPDPTCSRRQFSIIVGDQAECTLKPLSDRSPTLCEGLPIFDEVRLDRAVEITAGNSRFRFLPDNDESTSLTPLEELPPAELPTVLGYRPDSETEELPGPEAFAISGHATIGRDPESVDLVLPHIQVSRVHAQVVIEGRELIVTDLDSTAGVFVNGVRAERVSRIQNGETIGIGPFLFVFQDGVLYGVSRQDNLSLAARGLSKSVVDRETGLEKTILDHVSLVIRPQEFVAVIGPAGCGKSTLLESLSGVAKPNQGSVQLNDMDLHQNFDQLKSELAFVPQRDLLHRNLTVEQALQYTAKLRLPSDTTDGEVGVAVDQILETVGLSKHRTTRIADLSGGQTKRASLANEILSNPSVIYLDEVTSGLDEQSDGEMMRLFRKLADAGKTVVCITHCLANVEDHCHLLVVLAEGGKLAYVGTPRQTLEYFNVKRIGDIYHRLAEKQPDEWRRKFLKSDQYRSNVRTRLASCPIPESLSASAPGVAKNWDYRVSLRQTSILMSRYTRLLRGDTLAIAMTIGQCLLVACLIVLVFRDVSNTGQSDAMMHLKVQAGHCNSLLFITAISCFWFGCNNASKEFVKERDIFQKEYRAGLDIPAYYISKLIPLTAISTLQAVLLYLLVSSFCNLPINGSAAAITAAGLSSLGVALGLAISSLSKSEQVATVLVPMALIPQIILSGGLKPLTGFGEQLAQWTVSLYWGFGLLRGMLPEHLRHFIDSDPTAVFQSISFLGFHYSVFTVASLLGLRRTRQATK